LQSTLDPHGPAAGDISLLWWVLFWISVAVCLTVFACLLWALFRRRAVEDRRQREGHRLILTLGVALPSVILIGTFGFSLRTMLTTAAPASPAQLTIEVIGHQWWWEIHYRAPGAEFTTANELHLPVGAAAQVTLSAADVIHSFWVPELQKKVDMFPGRATTTWLQADSPGDYRGQCAEYCGLQHANMALHVVAEPPAQFNAWAEAQRQPAAPPADVTAGVQLFASQGCISCHTIRYGATPTGGTVGPDLTHVASRATIGAGTLPNDAAHLGGWILNSQAAKPGNLMPPRPMDQADVQALVIYLGSLR
jgi:cytochrome c oxidase subunit II